MYTVNFLLVKPPIKIIKNNICTTVGLPKQLAHTSPAGAKSLIASIKILTRLATVGSIVVHR